MAKKKKHRLKRKAKFMLLALFCLIVLTCLVVNVKSKNKLKLVGDKEIIINLLEDYIEEGVTYKEVDVLSDVSISSNVDNTKVGNYNITYTYITSKGRKLTVNREVIVKDLTLPNITLTGGNEVMIVKGEEYIELGFTAIDNIDGDITNNVKVIGSIDTSKEGEYTLTYEVKDSSGNVSKKNRTVTVMEKNPLTMSVKDFSLEGMFNDTILKEKEASQSYMEKIIYTGDSMVLYYDINDLVPTNRLWYQNGIDPKSALSASVYHKYIDTKKTLVEMYEENQPDISIITLGSNSVAYMDIEVFIENYETLLKKIMDVSKNTKLIVQSIPPVAKFKDDSNSPLNNDKINKFNYEIVKLCQKLNLKFLNSAVSMKDENGCLKEGYYIKDGIHPTKMGHKALYEYTKNHAYE